MPFFFDLYVNCLSIRDYAGASLLDFKMADGKINNNKMPPKLMSKLLRCLNGGFSQY